MKLTKIISCLFGLLMLTACGGSSSSEKIDEKKPIVNIVTPALNSSYDAGSNLGIEIDISDDVELDEYRITIQRSGVKSVKTVEEFSFNSQTDKDKKGNDLSLIKGKKSAKISFDITINEFAEEGVYTLTCKAYDEAGNEEKKENTFTINRN